MFKEFKIKQFFKPDPNIYALYLIYVYNQKTLNLQNNS